MKRAKDLLLTTVLLMLTTFAGAQVPVQVSKNIETFEGKAYYLHTVESQQTLYSIAKAYGVTVESILLNNPDARRGLRVNQVIRIPVNSLPQSTTQQNQPQTSQQPSSEDYEYIYHVAGKNETFAYVSAVYNLPERRIRDANPNRSEPFREGDYILIPILRKDRRAPITDSPQLRRSGFDPYNPPGQPTGPTRRDLVNAATNTQSGSAAPSNQPAPRQTTASGPSAATATQSQTSATTAASGRTAPIQPPDTYVQQTPQPQTTTSAKRPTRHVVRPQETLFSIARTYNLSVAQLQQANPGLNENIQVGQVLLLPSSETPQNSQQANGSFQEEVVIHTVQRGETLFRISRTYGVTIDELKRLNPGLTENIATGQQIRVPKKKISQPYLIHQVDKQQKTRQLAREYGLTTDELMQMNPSLGRNVFPRQEVKIPLQTKPFEVDHVFKSKEPLKPSTNQVGEQPANVAEPEVNHAKSKDQGNCEANLTNERQTYRIALLLPLYLDEAYSSRLPGNRAISERLTDGLNFLHFYQGFLLAADSLAAQFGLKAEILVFDVNQSDASVRIALADPRLKQVHLIIGPFFGQSFEQVALFAREHNIPIVNPVTQRRQVIQDNPYVIKLRPDPSALYQQLAQTIDNYYPASNIMVLHAPGRNLPEVSAIAETLSRMPSLTNADAMVHLLDFDRNDLNKFREMANTNRVNVVLVYSEDRAYAMDVLNRLNQVAEVYNIRLIGLPDWRKFDNLFIEHMMRLNLHLVDAVFVDFDDLRVRFFIHKFRNRFGIEPNSYAFEGFDVAWYFTQALQRYGTDFMPCLHQFKLKLLTNNFRFVEPDKVNGLENQNWNISRIQNYRFEPLAVEP